MDVRSLRHIIGFFVDQKDIATAEQAIDKITGKIAMIGAGLTAAFTVPLTMLSEKIIETMSTFEQWDVSFSTMLGDPNEAKALIKDVMDFAARTPFEIAQSMKGTKQLLAFGVEKDDIIGTMTDLGNVSAALDVPMTRLIHNFGQVKTMGKLMGREIRDFQVAGVPILDYVADVMGIAKENVQQLASEGKVSFDVMREAFRRMSGEGGRFANLMEKQSQTLGGQWSNFKDRITLSMLAFKDEWMPILKSGLNWISTKFDQLMKNLTPELIRFITVLGAILASLGPILLAVTAFLGAGLTLSGLFSGLGFIATTLGVSIGVLLAKFTLIIAAIAAVITIVALLIEDLWGYAKGQDSLFGRFFGPWNELKPKIMSIINSIWNYLKSFFSLIKLWFVGIAQILKGFVEGDAELLIKGLINIAISSLKMLKSFFWDLLTVNSLKFLEYITIKLSELIEWILIKIQNLWNDLLRISFEKAKAMYEKVKSFLSFGLFGDEIQTNAIATGGGGFGSASNSTMVNINANITTQVPEGNTEYQNDYLKNSVEMTAKRIFSGSMASELRDNIGRNG